MSADITNDSLSQDYSHLDDPTRELLQAYVFFRNSLVRAHCCLTRLSNSGGVTGRPEASSSSPSTNRTLANLK